MGFVTFGQPDDGVVQMAYVVEDIHRAMDEWVTHLKVGPWFLLESFTGVDARYRGRPTDASISLAMSFAGHMMIELLQEHRPVPSVYRETIETRGYGFHHWGIASKDFDADLARYESLVRNSIPGAGPDRGPGRLYRYNPGLAGDGRID
jgi:hypothetical protein